MELLLLPISEHNVKDCVRVLQIKRKTHVCHSIDKRGSSLFLKRDQCYSHRLHWYVFAILFKDAESLPSWLLVACCFRNLRQEDGGPPKCT